MQILIVEDEYLLATQLRDQLAELGYEDVILTGNVADGRHFIETARPDFVILDVNVGGAKAFAIAAVLRAQRIPFIFSTGEPREALPVEWRSWPLLAKPTRSTELSATLRAYAPKPRS